MLNMNTWTKDFWVINEDECKKTLMEPGNWKKVPYFESVNTPHLKTLVRFRGMIQDMLNPEYYCKSFSILNTVTNETKVCQGKYQSTVMNKPNEEILLGDDMMERQVISCIPIPGLNDWAKDIVNSNNEIVDESEGNVQKRLRFDPDYVKKGMLIFIYPEDEEFTNELKLNNIIEVVGFIDGYTIDIDNTEFADSMITDPNPDVPVLCIHTVQFKLFPDLYEKSIEMNNCIWEETLKLHAELKFILTQALLGDSLAADYLLFYLISTIYNRQSNEVPGKLSLNIRGIPISTGKIYVQKLYSLISFLVVKSKYLPLTIDTMNEMSMVPSKNYTTGRLTEGFLQLSNKTHLVIDETDLKPGRLDNKGVLNVEALKDIIYNQKIKYDFTYYKINYETEIPILTLSIGKSLLPCDIDIVLTPDPSCIENIEEIIDSVHKYLNSELLLLEKLRKYITLVSTFPFNFNEDILKIIENDYVRMRKEDVKNISPDDLHRFIMISKLIALSTGRNELNTDIWELCKALESQRKLRNK